MWKLDLWLLGPDVRQRALSSSQSVGDTEVIDVTGIHIQQAEWTSWELPQLGTTNEWVGKVAYIQRYIIV